MFEKKNSREKRVSGFKAQAIVEFAIVLPILLVVLVGILEVGRYIFIYSAATNASRNAVRYASAVGRADGSGLTKYNYCEGIRQVALESINLVDRSTISVAIDYDDGAGNSEGSCLVFDAAQVDTVNVGDIDTGDRVTVTVTVPYKPMVNLVPFETRPINSSSPDDPWDYFPVLPLGQ